MAMVDRERVRQLVESAPRILARTEAPMITLPERWEGVRGFGFFSQADPEMVKRLGMAARAAAEGRAKVWNVSAKTLLTAALETPKNVYSTHPSWFLHTIDGLVRMVTEQRFGRKGRRLDFRET